MITHTLVVALACAASPEAPHPIITEVLYAVPLDRGDPSLGDANLDGERHATGDEFIELFNPHDEPIELGGYVLSDAHPLDKNRFEFTFPELTLEPGQAAVVFNGKDQTFASTVGDAEDAGEPQPDFNNAYVLDAGNGNRMIGLANKGDAVVLVAPDGTPISFIDWGTTEADPPERCDLVATAPTTSKGSVVLADNGEWVPHGSDDGVPYSPGVHPTP